MVPEISTALNRPYIPSSGTKLTANIDVSPGKKQTAVERHIALCIDTSGSMSGEKIERAREGASWVFGLLEADDYISITTFDSDAERVLGPSRWGDLTRDEAIACVEELTAGGKTDMYEGIENAKNSLESLKFYDETAGTPVRRILVLSDGKDKEHEPADFRDIAVDVDESGIRIEAAGIGAEYNEETIRTLGTTARGEWTHLEAAGDIEDFFGDVVEQAKDVVAPDARLEVTPAPGVELSDVYRALPQAQEVELDWEAETAIVKLPDLTERESQEVVMQIHAPAIEEGQELGEVVLAEVTLTARGEDASDTISVSYTEDNEKLAVNNEDVQLSHQQTVIKTELGKGNVEAAETQVEKMTQIHGKETEVVAEAKRETEIVKEGGRAEQNRATKIVTDDDGVQK
ncbi:MAG: VWA domain-containing protein [Halovenus sp.]